MNVRDKQFQHNSFRISNRMSSEDEPELATAVPVILFREQKFELDEVALKSILMKDEIKDRSVYN